MNNYYPGKYLGAVSEKVHNTIKNFIKSEEEK